MIGKYVEPVILLNIRFSIGNKLGHILKESVLMCSQQFRKIHRNTSILESFLSKTVCLHPADLLKRHSGIGASKGIFEIFRNISVTEQFLVAASETQLGISTGLFNPRNN